jgi:hypothetical protein
VPPGCLLGESGFDQTSTRSESTQNQEALVASRGLLLMLALVGSPQVLDCVYGPPLMEERPHSVQGGLQDLWRQLHTFQYHNELVSLVRSLSPKELVDDLRKHLADDTQFGRHVQSHASMSPNGFLRLYLAPKQSSCQVRLHVWQETHFRSREPDIHNHRWPFASRVLCGRLRVDEFIEDTEGELILFRYRHQPSETLVGFRLESDGLARLRKAGERSLGTDAVYFTGEDALHRTTPETAVVATVLAEGLALSRATTVYRTDLGATGVHPSVRVTVEDILVALDRLTVALNVGPSRGP